MAARTCRTTGSVRGNAWSQRSTRCWRTPLPRQHHRDAVEGKLFGLGVEAYTVGSHELYLAYARATTS